MKDGEDLGGLRIKITLKPKYKEPRSARASATGVSGVKCTYSHCQSLSLSIPPLPNVVLGKI